MNILITGANGFVGRVVCDRIASKYPIFTSIYAVYRDPEFLNTATLHSKITPFISCSLDDLAANTELLSKIDCIIHLAARVHQMDDKASDPLIEFRAINTTATYNLAKAATKAGTQRFIYLSSIKVNGEETEKSSSYTESDQLSPQDPYGISKWEAETQLMHLAHETELEVVILRPPLVYGPKVKANFLQMIRTISKGIPLPLGAIRNQRSLVYVENLADAIINASIHPAAANQVFLVSDGEDISTSNLICKIAKALRCSPRLLPIPVFLLKLLGKLTGKSAPVDRLTGSLRVDSRKIRKTLNWTPPYTLDQGLQATADWYLDRSSKP
jgi:nucleoside-diphosphate-sugar epimerase